MLIKKKHVYFFLCELVLEVAIYVLQELGLKKKQLKKVIFCKMQL